MRTKSPSNTFRFPSALSVARRMFSFLSAMALAISLFAQFTVERSPWLDAGSVTDDLVNQTWTVKDAESNRSLDVELTVEGLNPRKPVSVRIQKDTMLKLQSQRRYTRICVEPDYMLFSDRIYANPDVLHDTLRLAPLAVGLEVELEPIVFYPGTNDLYFSSIPILEALLTFVEVNPTIAIAIQSNLGYESAFEDADMARRARARAVFEYLVSSGVNPNRLAIDPLEDEYAKLEAPQSIEEAEAAQRITVRVTNY